MKRLWFQGVLIIAATLTIVAQEHSRQTPDTWVRFNSELGRFTVMLPQNPTEKTETVRSNVGPYTTHLFSVRSVKTVFLVGWVDYAPSFNFVAQSELNANRDNFVKAINATVLNSNNARIDGYQSLEFTAETTDTVYRSRVYIVGRRPYQLIAGTVKGTDDETNVTRFFESFKIRPPTTR
ncbi:MAG TPA: hypothetical protein VF074_13465 [Pyrinomonadaceae bacterium]